MVPQTINVGMIIPCTEAEGPGKRFAVWVQGCPMRCKGCCNPEYLEFEDKRVMTVDQIMKMVLEAKSSHGVEGVTLLGGEPFSQAAALATLAGRVKKASMSVMVFSGFTKAALDKMAAPGVAELLAEIRRHRLAHAVVEGRRRVVVEVGSGCRGLRGHGASAAQAANDCPQPQVLDAFGFSILNPDSCSVSTKSSTEPTR